ncbi:unnamed protein product [Arabidopsis halleri]
MLTPNSKQRQQQDTIKTKAKSKATRQEYKAERQRCPEKQLKESDKSSRGSAATTGKRPQPYDQEASPQPPRTAQSATDSNRSNDQNTEGTAAVYFRDSSVLEEETRWRTTKPPESWSRCGGSSRRRARKLRSLRRRRSKAKTAGGKREGGGDLKEDPRRTPSDLTPSTSDKIRTEKHRQHHGVAETRRNSSHSPQNQSRSCSNELL